MIKPHAPPPSKFFFWVVSCVSFFGYFFYYVFDQANLPQVWIPFLVIFCVFVFNHLVFSPFQVLLIISCVSYFSPFGVHFWCCILDQGPPQVWIFFLVVFCVSFFWFFYGWKSFMYHIGWKGPNPYCSPFLSYNFDPHKK